MDAASNAKLLPLPPLDELLNERKRQALRSETEDAETRRTGIDGDAITRRLILEDFDSSFLRFSEDTAGPQSHSSHSQDKDYSPDAQHLTPDDTWSNTPNSTSRRSSSALSQFVLPSQAHEPTPLRRTHTEHHPLEQQGSAKQMPTALTSLPEDAWASSLGRDRHDTMSTSQNLSSDASSSGNSRASVWSRRTSQNSYETHGSSLAGDHCDVLQMSQSAPSDLSNFAMGITSDDPPPSRMYKAPIVSSSGSLVARSSSQSSGRFDHHRNPSWVRRPCPEQDTGSDAVKVEAQSDSLPPTFEPSFETALRPAPTRTPSQLSSQSSRPSGSPGPVLPAGAIPPRTKSRPRVQSESASSSGRTSKALSVETRPESKPSGASMTPSASCDSNMERLSSPISHGSPTSPSTQSPRIASLRPSGLPRSTSSGKGSLRAASIRLASQRLSRSGSKSSMASTSRGGSGMEELEEEGSLLPYARSEDDDSRPSSVVMLDMDELVRALDNSKLPANAVQVAEDGNGSIVEGHGRHPRDFEHEIDAHTTHLIVSHCKSTEQLPFLERALRLCSKSLLVLDISDTALEFLPSCLSDCSQLEELNVSGNKLGSLPAWLGGLFKLRVLIADGAELGSIPFGVSRLTSLSVLSVRNNRLSHLPSWLHLLTGLERLYVQDNPFQGSWSGVIATLLPGQSPTSSAPQSSRMPWTPMFDSPTQEGLPRSPAERGRRTPMVSGLASSRQVSESSQSRFSNDSSVVEVLQDEPTLSSGAQGSGNRATSSNEIAPRRGAARRPKTSDSDGKWGFFKRATRRGSNPTLSGLSLPQGDAGARTEDDRTGSVLGFRKFSSSSSRPGTSPSLKSAPLREVTPGQQRAELSRRDLASSSDSPTKSRSSRISYLPLQQSSLPPTEGDHAFGEEEPLEQLRRVRALLCYLRDLDDLTAKGATQATRPALSSSSSHHSGTGSFSSGFGGSLAMSSALSGDSFFHGYDSASAPSSGASSPIRRRLSAAQLTADGLPSAGDIKDNSTRRRRIISEIISTEQSYLRGLQELCDIYVKPARVPDPSTGQPVLTPQDHRGVFNNVEGLLQFHQGAFLPSLSHAADALLTSEDTNMEPEQDAQLTASAAEAVAGVFCKHAAFFRMYSTYVNGCDEAQARITAWMAATSSNSHGLTLGPKDSSSKDAGELIMSSSQKKKFKAFMKRCRADARHTQLNLQSYTLLPVQRLPRYEMLLKELARSTDPARLANPNAVNIALGQITTIAASVNESKRQSEQDKKLLAWQGRLRGKWPMPLVQPHRRLVSDGSLMLRRVVQRTPAFDVQAAVDAEEALHDGAFSGRGKDVQHVDCLRQQIFSQPLTLLLCNDICVTLRDARSPSISSTFSSTEPRQVDIFAILSIQPSGPDSQLCQLVGQSKHLRVVDSRRIYYFSAATPAEAASWCESINNSAVSC